MSDTSTVQWRFPVGGIVTTEARLSECTLSSMYAEKVAEISRPKLGQIVARVMDECHGGCQQRS